MVTMFNVIGAIVMIGLLWYIIDVILSETKASMSGKRREAHLKAERAARERKLENLIADAWIDEPMEPERYDSVPVPGQNWKD